MTFSGVQASLRTGPVEAFVTIPNGTFHVGDTVTLTVRVFDGLSPVDPTNLSVTLTNIFPTRYLAYARQALGVFSVAYQILPGDVPNLTYAGVSPVTLAANATAAGVTSFGYGNVLVWAAGPAFQVALSSSTAWVLPGVNVTITATILSGGVPTNPDMLYVNESEAFPLGGTTARAPVPMTRTGPGTYSGVFRTPSDSPQGTSASFTATATLGVATAFSEVGIGIGVAPAFTIWEHLREITPNYTLVDIDIANSSGWPVPGAEVALFPSGWQCAGYPCQPPMYDSATTDRLGTASLNVTYSYHPFFVFMAFLGYVRLGDLNQTFAGRIISRSLYQPYRDLCPSDGLVTYAPGSTVHRTYHASCGYGSQNATFDYYAYTTQALVSNGTVQADADGNFTLTFTVPGQDLYVRFLQNVSGLGWVTYYDSVAVADPSEIRIANLSIGQTAQITVDMTGVLGSVALELYNATDAWYPESPDWLPLSCCTSFFTVPAIPGAPFHADLVLPRFLPKDQDYLLTVRANSTLGAPYSGFNWGPSYTYAEVVHMTNTPPTAAASFSTLNPIQGEAVSANASAATDPDGVIMAYRFDWGDGNSTGWTDAPTAIHAFADPGTYIVTVHVEDDSGAHSTTNYSVVVEPAILGVRASTFYLVTLIAVVAAVAAVAVAIYLRRMRARSGKPPTGMPPETPLEAGPKPPGGP